MADTADEKVLSPFYYDEGLILFIYCLEFKLTEMDGDHLTHHTYTHTAPPCSETFLIVSQQLTTKLVSSQSHE